MIDEEYVDIAIETAKNAPLPYGAILVKNNEIIGRSDREVFVNKTPFTHAELMAIENAIKDKEYGYDLYNKLEGCTLYCSCEPCMICMGAILYEGISKIVFAASLEDSNTYYCKENVVSTKTLANLLDSNIEIIGGIHREKAIEIWKK